MRGMSIMGIVVLVLIFYAGSKWGAPLFAKVGL